MCYAPVSIQTPQGRINVPCGKCVECLQKRRSEWTFRLLQEVRIAKSAAFVTLTYDDEYLPLDLNLKKDDLQRFIKRARKANAIHEPSQVRYYAVGEYGENNHRPHYHLIIFNLSSDVMNRLESIWGLGFVKIGDVSQASIHYVTKYMLVNQKSDKVKPFALMSKRPYIGHSYINPGIKRYHKISDKHRVSYLDGIKVAMPRVYKGRLFSKVERLVNAKEILQIVDKKEMTNCEKWFNEQLAIKEKRKRLVKTRKMDKQSKSKKV